jgi:hypothetical protein
MIVPPHFTTHLKTRQSETLTFALYGSRNGGISWPSTNPHTENCKQNITQSVGGADGIRTHDLLDAIESNEDDSK